MLQESRERMNEKELMDLWLGYISWREGRGLGSRRAKGGAEGGIDDVVDIYAQCIDMMGNREYPTSESEFPSSTSDDLSDPLYSILERTVAEENMVYLLLRCVLLLRHAGKQFLSARTSSNPDLVCIIQDSTNEALLFVKPCWSCEYFSCRP